jgi:hypothetical protein
LYSFLKYVIKVPSQSSGEEVDYSANGGGQLRSYGKKVESLSHSVN